MSVENLGNSFSPFMPINQIELSRERETKRKKEVERWREIKRAVERAEREVERYKERGRVNEV